MRAIPAFSFISFSRRTHQLVLLPRIFPQTPGFPCCLLGIRCRPDGHPVREGDLCTEALSASLCGFSHGSHLYLASPCELICVSVYCLDSNSSPRKQFLSQEIALWAEVLGQEAP